MFNTSKFSFKIFFTVFLGFSLLFCVSSWISYSLLQNIITKRLDDSLVKTIGGIRQMVETSADLAARNYLRSLAEHSLNVAQEIEAQAAAGQISEEAAKQEVMQRLSDIKIGKSGYIYIVTSEGTLEAHPHQSLQGTNIIDQDFIKSQSVLKQGYIEYEWANPGEEEPREKLLYMEYFEPWDWIISASAYGDELGLLVEASDYRKLVLSINIGEHGYPFLMNTYGEVLIHPFLSGDINLLPVRQKEVLEQIIASRNGKIFYDDFEGDALIAKKKIAVYETIESYGWIVVGSAFLHDFYQPLELLKRLLVALLCVGFVISGLVSLYLSRSITLPIKGLLQTLSEESVPLDNGDVAPESSSEIEELTFYFNNYIEQIKSQHLALQKLIEEQGQVVLDLNIFKEVFDNIAEGISITDTQGTIQAVNPAFETITGYSRSEAIGQNPRILKSEKHAEDFYALMWRDLEANGYWTGEIWNKRKNGEIYPEWLTISAVKNKEGVVCNYAAVFKDITELTRQKEKISFLAYHDHLTKLPNRLMISERIREALSESRRHNSTLICLVLDIDDFKTINDTIGHEKGDILLVRIIERIKPILRLEDVFGRVGSDDFVILAKSDPGQPGQVEPLIDRLFSAFTTPFSLDDHVFYITLSIGVTMYPGDGETDDKILSNAMLALNNAEKIKGNSYCFYNRTMEEEVAKKVKYLAKIREGLNQHEFIAYYQPKISLAEGTLVGIEALARWKTEDGLVSPAEFIPIAEESRLIVEMSWQIYERAFGDCQKLIERGNPLHVSVNISPYQLQSESFMADFLKVQEASGLARENIDLEITESALHENIDHVIMLLERIAEAGFSLSIDDFGTGYSSLGYLKNLPFSTLKIDRSFISGIDVDPDDEQIVRTVILLAKQFDMNIVAEGIETHRQINFLNVYGCDQGQGFYYGKPMDFNELLAWIDSHTEN